MRSTRPLLAALLAACATTGPARAATTDSPMAPGVKGGIAWARPASYLDYEAVWSDTRVAAGKRGGPPQASFERQADGTWRTGVTVIEAKGNRLVADEIDVTFTRLPDGFSLTGTFFLDNVNLVVTSKGAQAQQFRYVRNEKGAYESQDVRGSEVLLVGEAARLEDPRWPEIALAMLAARWGVHPGAWLVNPVTQDVTRASRPDVSP